MTIQSYVLYTMFAAACLTPAWHLCRVVVTVCHELGHAVTAVVVGGNVTRVRIMANASGHARWENPVRWGSFRNTVVVSAGYPAPAVVAVLFGVAVGYGRTEQAVIGVTAACIVALVFWARHPFTVLVFVTIGGGAGLCAYLRFTEQPVIAAAGLLAAGSVRCAVEQWRATNDQASDASVLAKFFRVRPKWAAGVLAVITIGIAASSAAVTYGAI